MSLEISFAKEKMSYPKWKPSKYTTRHSGAAVPEDMDFFVSPNPLLGNILTVESTLRESDKSIGINGRLKSILLGTLLLGILTLVIVELLVPSINTAQVVVIGITALAIGWAVYSQTKFEHKCSFVGEQGISEVEINGSRSNKPIETKLLLFSDVAGLRSDKDRHYMYGAYKSTSYYFEWFSENKCHLSLRGEHRSKSDEPDDDDIWHFANSAEAAWTRSLWKFRHQQIASDGYIDFAVNSNPNTIRISSGFIELFFKDSSNYRINRRNLDVSFRNRTFHFAFRESNQKARKFRVSYSKISNAKMFLEALERFLGISWPTVKTENIRTNLFSRPQF